MAHEEQSVKVKCPYCGWLRSFNAKVLEDESVGDGVKGLSDTTRGVVERIQIALLNSNQNPESYWVDMPVCPNCNNIYQYNAKTKEMRK